MPATVIAMPGSAEFEETRDKAGALLQALAMAQAGL